MPSNPHRTARLFVGGGLFVFALACFLPLALHPADILVGPQRNGLNDLTGYCVGVRDYPRVCLARFHQLPFWNPTTAGGAPYLGNPQAAFFYPPNWLFWICGARGLISWVLVGHHLIAGIGAYGLARKLGMARLGAFSAGVAFLGSPILIARTAEGHMGSLGVLAWTPWGFWMYERFRDDPRRIGGLAVVLALAILAGHIQEAYYLVLALTIICLVDASQQRSVKLLLRWAQAGLATAGLVMAELIPMAIFARNSARGAGLFGGISIQSSAGMASLAQLLNPFALGGPKTYQGPGTYFWESLCYFGIVPVVLAVLGLLVATRERRPVLRPAAVGAVAFLFALGGTTPLYPLMHRIVPGVSLFRYPSRALFLPGLAVAMLCGLGIDTVAAAGRDQDAWLRANLRTCVLAIILILGGAAFFSEVSLRLTLGQPRFWLWLAGGLLPVALAAFRPAQAWRCGGCIVGLLAIELAGFSQAIVRTVAPTGLRQTSPFVERFEADRGSRTMSRQLILSDREATAHGVLKLEGYDPIPLTRTLAFLGAVQLDSSPIQGLFGIKSIDLASARPNLLDLLSVRHAVLLKSDVVPDSFGWQVVATGQAPALVSLRGEPRREVAYRVFENPHALPRAFALGTARILKPGEDVKATLGTLDPLKVVLLEHDLLHSETRQEFTPARLIEDTPNRVVVEVETTEPAYLVLTDSLYPGWSATITGQPTPILPANIAFRAVALPKVGTQRVVFAYHPVGVVPGLAVSLLTVFLLARSAWPRSWSRDMVERE